MTILSAQSIRKAQPVTPFHERSVFNGMSWGLSCCGYDIRIAENLVIRPGQFGLASSLEKFNMPPNVCGMVKDKSTLARRGLAVQNTIIEPGWRGFLTLELTNHANRGIFADENIIRLPAGSPIAQVVFTWLDEPSEQLYVGKYQDQEAGPQPARHE